MDTFAPDLPSSLASAILTNRNCGRWRVPCGGAYKREDAGIIIKGSHPMRFAWGAVALLLMGLPMPGAEVDAGGRNPSQWVSVVREKDLDEGALSVVSRSSSATNGRANSAKVVFRAIANQSPWPAGLVPIYAGKTGDQFELRRLPPPGEMDQAEPLFFALPAEPGNAATLVGGTWNCVATHPDGQRKRVALDLVAAGSQVAARFDPNSDYRFASITSASFQSNRLQLAVAYVNNRYQIEGRLTNGVLVGNWKQLETDEGGTWEGRRSTPDVEYKAQSAAVPLFEYERQCDGARYYSLDAKWTEAGWRRREAPLCRVWPPPDPPTRSADVYDK